MGEMTLGISALSISPLRTTTLSIITIESLFSYILETFFINTKGKFIPKEIFTKEFNIMTQTMALSITALRMTTLNSE